MTGRERVIAAIDFRGPDRIPLKLDVALPEPLVRRLSAGLPGGLKSDFLHNAPGWYVEGERYGRNLDAWACEWLNLRGSGLGQVVGHPLADPAALSTYRWPDPDALDMSSAVRDARDRGGRYFLLGYVSLFERMINLRGFEDLLLDIASEPAHLFEILDRVLGYNMRLIERMLALKPDGIFLADDWGTQLGLMINPAQWRRLFLPAYRRMIRTIMAAGAHAFFHSDGKVTDILLDLLDCGAGVFWVEIGVNGLDWLSRSLGGKAAFLSLHDTQTLEFGTPREIEAMVREEITALGRFGGGYIAQVDGEDDEKNGLLIQASLFSADRSAG